MSEIQYKQFGKIALTTLNITSKRPRGSCLSMYITSIG